MNRQGFEVKMQWLNRLGVVINLVAIGLMAMAAVLAYTLPKPVIDTSGAIATGRPRVTELVVLQTVVVTATAPGPSVTLAAARPPSCAPLPGPTRAPFASQQSLPAVPPRGEVVSTGTPSGTEDAAATVVTRVVTQLVVASPQQTTTRLNLTPFPVTRKVDLDPTLPQEQKWQVIIFRCDGTWEADWLAMDATYPARLNLQPGDVIYEEVPPGYLSGGATGVPTARIQTGSTATPRPNLNGAYPSPLTATGTRNTGTVSPTRSGTPAPNRATGTPYPVP